MQIAKLLSFIFIFISSMSLSHAEEIDAEEMIAQQLIFEQIGYQMSRCQTEKGRWKQGVIKEEVLGEDGKPTGEKTEIDCTALLEMKMEMEGNSFDREEYFQCATQDWDVVDSLPLAKKLVLKLNEVYNCPGEKETTGQCVKDVACNLVNSIPAVKLLKKGTSYFSDNEFLNCSTGSDCLSEALYGVVKNLTTNIGGVWEGMKWAGKKLCLWCESEEVEDATSESMHMASAQEDGFFDKLKNAESWGERWEIMKGAVGNLFTGLYNMVEQEVENNFACAKWAEPRYTSALGNEPKCEEPFISSECATCSQKMNMACGVVGFLGGEAIIALLTGGAVNVASKVGSAIARSEIVVKVANAAATVNKAVGDASEYTWAAAKNSKVGKGLGKITGVMAMGGNASMGIVKVIADGVTKFAIRVGKKLFPVSDEMLAMIKSNGLKGLELTGKGIAFAAKPATWYLDLLEKSFIFGQRGKAGLALYSSSKIAGQADTAIEVARAANYPKEQLNAYVDLQKKIGNLQESYVDTVQKLQKKAKNGDISPDDKAKLAELEQQLENAKVAASDLKNKLDSQVAARKASRQEEVKANASLSDEARKQKAADELRRNNPSMTDTQVDRASQAVVDANKVSCDVNKCSPSQLAQKMRTMRDAGVPRSQQREFIRSGMTGSSQDIPIPLRDLGNSNARVLPPKTNPFEPGISQEVKDFRLDLSRGVIDGDARFVSYTDPKTGKRLPVELDPTDLNNTGGFSILRGRVYKPGKDGNGTFEPVVLYPDDLQTVRRSSTSRTVHTDPTKNRSGEPRFLKSDEVVKDQEVSIISGNGQYTNGQITKVDKSNNVAEVRIVDNDGAIAYERVEINGLRTPTGGQRVQSNTVARTNTSNAPPRRSPASDTADVRPQSSTASAADEFIPEPRVIPSRVNPNQAGLYPEKRNFRLAFQDGKIDGDARFVSYRDPNTNKKVLVELDPTDLNKVGGEPYLKGRAYRPGKDGAPPTFEPIVIGPDDIKTVGTSKRAKELHTDPNTYRADEPISVSRTDLKTDQEVTFINNRGEYQEARVSSIDSTGDFVDIRFQGNNGSLQYARVETNGLRFTSGQVSRNGSRASNAVKGAPKRSPKIETSKPKNQPKSNSVTQNKPDSAKKPVVKEPKKIPASKLRRNLKVSVKSGKNSYQNGKITNLRRTENKAEVEFKYSDGSTYTEVVDLNKLKETVPNNVSLKPNKPVAQTTETVAQNTTKPKISNKNKGKNTQSVDDIVEARNRRISDVKANRNVSDTAFSNSRLSDKARENKIRKMLRKRNPYLSTAKENKAVKAVMAAHEKFPCEVGKCTNQQLAGKIELMKKAGVTKDMYRRFLKDGLAGNPPNSTIGSTVRVPRSNGGNSNGQVVGYNKKTGEVTVAFEGPNGQMAQKTLNPSRLEARAPDAGDLKLQNGIQNTGNPNYRMSSSPSSNANPNIGDRIAIRSNDGSLNTGRLAGGGVDKDGNKYITLVDEKGQNSRNIPTSDLNRNSLEIIPDSVATRRGNQVDNSSDDRARLLVQDSNVNAKSRGIDVRAPRSLPQGPKAGDKISITDANGNQIAGDFASYNPESGIMVVQRTRFTNDGGKVTGEIIKTEVRVTPDNLNSINVKKVDRNPAASIPRPEPVRSNTSSGRQSSSANKASEQADVVAKTKNELPKKYQEGFNRLDPQAQRRFAEQIQSSETGRRQAFETFDNFFNSAPVKPNVVLNSNQSQLVDNYLKLQQEYLKIKRSTNPGPYSGFRRDQFKEKMKNIRSEIAGIQDPNVRERMTELLREGKNDLIARDRSMMAKRKANKEKVQEALIAADESIPEGELLNHFRSLDRRAQEEIATELAKRSASGQSPETVFNEMRRGIQKNKPRNSNISPSRSNSASDNFDRNEIVEFRTKINSTEVANSKLDERAKELENQIKEKRVVAGSLEVDNPMATGRATNRGPSGRTEDINSIDPEYRSQGGVEVKIGKNSIKVDVNVSEMTQALNGSGLSRSDIEGIRTRFSTTPSSREQLGSVPEMERAVKYLRRIEPEKLTPAQEYILQTSQLRSTYYRINDFKNKSQRLISLRRAGTITDVDYKSQMKKLWEDLEKYAPNEVPDDVIRDRLKKSKLPEHIKVMKGYTNY